MHHLGVSGSWSRKYLEIVERLSSDILQSAMARQRQEGLTLGEMLHFPLCKAEQGSRRLLLSQLATVCGEDKIGEVQVFGYHHFPKPLLHIPMPMLYYHFYFDLNGFYAEHVKITGICHKALHCGI